MKTLTCFFCCHGRRSSVESSSITSQDHRTRQFIAANENVLYYWSLLTEDVNDATKAFSMISNLWVTIRKFAFVSAWMELHKQALRKGSRNLKHF